MKSTTFTSYREKMNPQLFKDHFSQQSGEYAQHRPDYPDALFSFLATLNREHDLAVDIGTGSGQAAVALTKYYREVVGIDPSAEQLKNARSHSRVRYVEAMGESTGLKDDVADLITVAQALHWFRFDAFFKEIRRIAKPNAVFASWGYGLATCTAAVDRIVSKYYHGILGSCWPVERKYVETGYHQVPFPFEKIPTPGFTMIHKWSSENMLNYLGTWSATINYRNKFHEEPLETIRHDLINAWGPDPRIVEWPIHLLVGRIS